MDFRLKNDMRHVLGSLSKFRHRKSGFRTPPRLNIAPDDHAKMSLRSIRRSTRRPRLGFGTALVPLSRPHPLFPPATVGNKQDYRRERLTDSADSVGRFAVVS